MSEKIKIGVMGCAAIAERSVIPAIQKLSDKFLLVCIASRTEDKAVQFSKKFNCKPIVGYDKLLEEDIDAVYIPLPTGLHDEWVMKALRKRIHVYAEKSLAYTFESANRMVNISETSDLALMEGYMFQYHPQHNLVKEMLRNDDIGGVRCFRSSFCFPPLGDTNFRYNEAIGGGVIHDATGYPLRAVHFILGSDFEVTSSSLYKDEKYGTEIYGSAFLKNKNGIGAQITFGFDNYYQCNYEIIGSKGKITVNRAFTPRENFSPTILLERNGKEDELIVVDPCDHFQKAMEEFFRIIINKDARDKHYKQILLQSKNLELIKKMA